MAKKKKQAAAEEAEAKSSKVKLAGMAFAFIAIGAVVGPKVMGGAAPPAEASDTTTTTAAGPIVVLDKVTLNLADGHLLQVGLALELSAESASAGGGHGEAASEDDPTKGYAKAIDATIEILGEETLGHLAAAGGREEAKHALEARLHELYHGEIVGVYFHQFVMQ
jgi:flagellar FliL protein